MIFESKSSSFFTWSSSAANLSGNFELAWCPVVTCRTDVIQPRCFAKERCDCVLRRLAAPVLGAEAESDGADAMPTCACDCAIAGYRKRAMLAISILREHKKCTT